MRPLVPRQSAYDPSVSRPEGDAASCAELAAVTAAARRRAVRDGDRQIDTAHLLHSLLETDHELHPVIGDAPQIARLLGYLVQRSIGYGLRWQGAVEDSGALPVVARAGAPDGGTEDADGWSPLAASALAHARDRAGRRGDGRTRGADLLAGLVRDPGARAVEVLDHAGVERSDLLARIDGRPGECAGSGETAH
ncbi:Clp protease N-terminal domain-containing protein [Streptomyces sp. NPDC086787]|uniref:Clp protease N-terminal domain-containing protein n=1 Tax=Streptomyces sp. NPDC086787 TaxID=3365759 RepID=UPI00380FB8BA